MKIIFIYCLFFLTKSISYADIQGRPNRGINDGGENSLCNQNFEKAKMFSAGVKEVSDALGDVLNHLNSVLTEEECEEKIKKSVERFDEEIMQGTLLEKIDSNTAQYYGLTLQMMTTLKSNLENSKENCAQFEGNTNIGSPGNPLSSIRDKVGEMYRHSNSALNDFKSCDEGTKIKNSKKPAKENPEKPSASLTPKPTGNPSLPIKAKCKSSDIQSCYRSNRSIVEAFGSKHCLVHVPSQVSTAICPIPDDSKGDDIYCYFDSPNCHSPGANGKCLESQELIPSADEYNKKTFGVGICVDKKASKTGSSTKVQKSAGEAVK